MFFVNTLATFMLSRRAFPTFRHTVVALAASLLLVVGTVPWANADPNRLPNMAGSGGGLISAQEERNIRNQVLAALKRSAPVLQDPLLMDYLEDITYRLVPHAELDDRDLTLLILDEPQLNAFAVPGGLIGINAGLFLYSDTEHQFASVIGHEIAHISQRHFSRRMDQQRADTPWTIAGLVAGILLAAATGSQAGIAAIAGTQAMAVDNMLRYSRQHEQEADRVGLEMMHRAGLDPRGMPEMFENMQRRARARAPEYLSTHPLTESRISDSRSRAERMAEGPYSENLEYHLMRARVIVRYADSAENAAERFRRQAERSEGDRRLAAVYGQAHALRVDGEAEKAKALFEELLDAQEGRITFVVGLANALRDLDELEEAEELLTTHERRNRGNLPLTRTLAETLMDLDRPREAARLYDQLTRRYPRDETLWDALADAQGQARNIVEVHRARGEREMLMLNYDAAIRQFRQALDKTGTDHTRNEVLRQRLGEAQEEARNFRRVLR